MVPTICAYSLIMKTLHDICEGLLDADDLDKDITTGTEVALAGRLNKLDQDLPTAHKDMAGRKIKIGDNVIVFGNHLLRIAVITEIARGGKHLTVASINDSEQVCFPDSNDVLKIADITLVSQLLKMLAL